MLSGRSLEKLLSLELGVLAGAGGRGCTMLGLMAVR